MSADHRAVLTADPTRPTDVVEALRPEEDAVPGEAEASVETSGGGVRIEVCAPDVGSLRAGLAGWTALLDVATDAIGPS